MGGSPDKKFGFVPEGCKSAGCEKGTVIKMKEYFRYFKWLYIVLGATALLLLFLTAGHWAVAGMFYQERTNQSCTTQERVFDYGDVLTDQEEDKLRKLIAKREAQTGCDIILVTLQESLKDYARGIEPWVSYEEFVRVYAEQFYEDNHFGYDQPDGDGILLVDNWYREDDGHIYTWLCTTGKVKDKYSDAAVDHILDNVYRYVERDPYRAYKTYVNDFYHDMLGIQVFHLYVPDSAPWIAGLIAAVIFIICNRKSKKGTKTTTAVTYVAGAQPQFRVKEDRFLRKSVVTRRIETGIGHGGGGGGGGGGSHGGGGHSR